MTISRYRIPEMKASRKVARAASVLIGLIVYYWFARETDTNPMSIIEGVPHMLDFTRRMIPPDIGFLSQLAKPALVTFQISVMGTTLGCAIAFPLCFLAARNFTQNWILYNTIRFLFNMCRGVSELVWAILFVSMVGLGSFPGVLAQVVYATGALGKYFSEAIENMNQDSIDALRATGANQIQIAFQGILPEMIPIFFGYVLWNWEHNIRSASVLGMVGAGGIGLELMSSMKLFRYQEVLSILIVIVVMVTLVDRISAIVRARVIVTA